MKKFIIAILLFILAWIACTQILAPRLLRKKIQNIVQKCSDCELDWDKLTFSLLGDQISFLKVRISLGDPNFTGVIAIIDEVKLDISLGELFLRKLHVRNIYIDAPEVTVTEGDGKTPDSDSSMAKILPYKIDAISIRDGKFLYIRTYKPRAAVIRVRNITGEIGALDVALGEQETEARAQGILENSGHFVLTLRSPPYSNVQKIAADLRIEAHDLAHMNPYFENAGGVRLKGLLLRAHAVSNLLEKNIDAWVYAKYKDLNIHFQKTKERSALSAFFLNLLKSIQLDKSDIDEEVAKQTKGVSIQRKPQESLVSFILRGMMDSAMKIASD